MNDSIKKFVIGVRIEIEQLQKDIENVESPVAIRVMSKAIENRKDMIKNLESDYSG